VNDIPTLNYFNTIIMSTRTHTQVWLKGFFLFFVDPECNPNKSGGTQGTKMERCQRLQKWTK